MNSAIPVPKITVSSIQYPAYDFQYVAGLDSSPSEIQISFVSKDGEYKEPALNILSPVTITLGDKMVFNYFPIESSIKRNPNGGNILQVTFIDGSFILDKIWVGLLNKHGTQSQYPILIVGEEVHPCNDPEATEIDNPCDPCSEESVVDCKKQAQERILDVRYNFNHLLDKIESLDTNIEIENRPPRDSFNDKYYSQYSGTLRDVLKNWCDDYGMSFYWSKNNKIKFIDLRAGFNINTKNLTTQKEVTSKNVVNSIRDTSCHGIIGHFAQDKQELNFNCSKDNYIGLLLKCVNLKDITESSKLKAYGGFKGIEQCLMLSYYSETIRDLFLIKDFYSLDNYSNIKSKEGDILPLLGNMKILKTFSKESSNEIDKYIFNLYLQLLIGESNAGNKISADSTSLLSKDFTIVVAEQDDSLKAKFFDFENKIAQTFFGRYYIRKYGNAAKNINWLTPGGSNVRYYEAAHNYANELPFINLLEDYVGVSNKLSSSSSIFARTDEGVQTDDSFLMLERDAVWNPSINGSDVQSVVNEASKFVPQEIPKYPIGELKNILNGENVKVLLFPSLPSSIKFTYGATKNSLDKDKLNLRFVEGNIRRNWGLRNNSCIGCEVKVGSSKIVIEGASQGTSFYANLPRDAGFNIIGNTNGRNLTKTIPKLETAILKLGNEEVNYQGCENTLQTTIVIKEIKEELSTILNQYCVLDENSINSLIDSYLSRLHYTVDNPYRKEEYSLVGLPEDNFEPEDGLTSFKSTLSDSQGWISDLTFETIRKKLTAQELIIKNFENYIEQYTRGTKQNTFTSAVDSSSIEQ